MKLSNPQLDAIDHYKGPALVLAGPGSGKTTVITYRIRNLITKYHVNPSNILVITFTKAATLEMKERFYKLSKGTGVSVTFGTFHAIYFSILKHTYHYSVDCIITLNRQIEIIRELTATYELDSEDENEQIHSILAEISQVKNGRILLSDFHSISCPEEIFPIIYKRYQEKLKYLGLLDFDDMLLECFEFLVTRPELCNAWQEKFQYILIDEFQDINQVQFDVISMLAEKHRNIFVVGDDDQSIYGFRGSKPEIMRNFQKVYDDAIRIDLTENYRSHNNIVNVAKSLVNHNQNRLYKNITAMSKECGSVQIHEVAKMEDEYTFVMKKIKELYDVGIGYDEMAVLYRINSIGGILSGKMLLENIPSKLSLSQDNIYEHWIAKDMIAYLKAAKGDLSRNNILRFINKPMRYITRSYLTDPFSVDDLEKYYVSNVEMLERIEGLKFDLKMIGKMNTFAALNYVRKATNYDSYIREFAAKHHLKIESLLEIADEIVNESKKYERIEDWFTYIDEYGRMIKEAKNNRKSLQKAVHMQTMHQSKGLEFRVVFILDFNEGMIPYKKAILADEIEEERRMLYVAMTRAKEYLYIVYSKERYNKKMTASRFLEELDPQSCEIHLLEDKSSI